MIACPNYKSKEWINLVAKVGETKAYLIWNEDEVLSRAKSNQLVNGSYGKEIHNGQLHAIQRKISNINDRNAKAGIKEVYKVIHEQTSAISGYFTWSITKLKNGLDIKAKIKRLEDRAGGLETQKSAALKSVSPNVGEQTSLFNETTKAGKIDEKISEKYFNDSNETDALSILNKIANSKHILAKLATRFLNYSKYNNVKIILEDVESFANDPKNTDFRANAYYNSKTNTIHIAKNAQWDADGVERVILHEILHSISHKKLRDGSKVSRDLNELYEYALSKLDKSEFYGLTNIDEFMVALFENPKLIKALSKIEPSKKVGKYKNLLEEIFNYILSLLNIGKTSSLYEQAYSVATNVLNDYNEASEAMEASNNEDLLYSKAADGKEKVKPAFEPQYVFFKRRINKLKKELDKISPNTDEYTIKETELNNLIEKLNTATEERDKEAYVEMANEYLDWVENLIKNLPDSFDKYQIQDITDAFEILNTFDKFTGLKGRPSELREKLFPYIVKHNLKTINKFDTSKDADGNKIIITEVMVDEQEKDIRSSSGYFGSLSDLYHYIGRTIGSLIKKAQNTASTNNKIIEASIQKEVNKLGEYASKNGMTLEEVYDIFIQVNGKGTLVLTQKHEHDGKLNPNFDKINNTPELKSFYDFYQSTLKAASNKLPYNTGKYYILNKVKSDIKSDWLKIIPSESILFDSFVSNEELLQDVVPDQFRNDIPAEKKSRNLGDGLLQFAAYANNHNELSKALPEVRLLQEQLRFKQDADGTVAERSFISSSDPNSAVMAEDSNIYKMVKTHIDMQIKGKMRVNKTKPIKTIPIKSASGEIIGYKQLHVEDIIDKGLRWNSLLRIGLSPITAIANVLFGDVSNIIEAVGGRHFNFKELKSATNIFFKQINYTSNEKTSNLYQWLERLNPLQELADYDLGSNLQSNPKKLTTEKAMEMMYVMQKKGELFLQSRTMIAVLIHDGYMNNDGTNTGKVLTEDDATQLADKIQRLNQQIHGRYSQREAAALQQSVWYRMVIQFRKWIPAAVESRFGDLKYDNRLQVDVEGRYRSGIRNVFKSGSIGQSFENMFLPLLNSKKAIESGKMTKTEIYNMRKNMIEAVLLTATVLIAASLKSGDDDERRRKLKNPLIKSSLVLLNRISGDINFFYNPKNISNIMGNAASISKLIEDIYKVGMNIPHAFYMGDYEVKRGYLKGSNSFWSQDIEKIIPGFAPAAQIQRIANHTDILQELN